MTEPGLCETLQLSPLLSKIHLQRRLKLSPDLQQVSRTATGFIQDPPPSLLQLYCGLWSLACHPPDLCYPEPPEAQASRPGAGGEMLQLPTHVFPDAPPVYAVSLQTLTRAREAALPRLHIGAGGERLLLVLADLKPCGVFPTRV